MSENEPLQEVACTLAEEQEKERSEDVVSLLIEHYSGYEERDDGVNVKFEGADEALEAVAQFVSNELQCCSFAVYNIIVAPPFEETVLAITGPDGTAEMFHNGLVKRLEDAT